MWKIVIFVLFEFCGEIKTKQVTGRYECGEHGKFEYCLEGVPGCVIGCHCHPGYYFDTDTKVCEPNNKLAQNYRKYNSDDGPTRKQFDLNVYPTRVNDDEFTTVANIDEKINDDLGDWLYNQFFKTVENQVLNETSHDPDTPSRRSNGNGPTNTPSRRSKKRKKGKKKSKKRKSRKDRRRKLLRIPSDDPMWETSGESNSDSSSSSGSSSESGSSGSNEKKKSERDKDGKSDKKKSDHDHSKFLIIKKQPKPPLPSFIFLPNVETPYYPSVGIAAAAAMPMYPMVPVPPMVSYPGTPGAMPAPGMPPGPGEMGGIPPVPGTSTTVTNIVPSESSNTPAQGKEDAKDDKETDDKNQKAEEVISPINRSGVRMRKLRKKGRNDRQQHAKQAPDLSRRHHKIQKAPLPLPIQTNFPVPTLNEARNEPTIQVIQAPSKPQQNMPDDPDKLENIKYLSQLIRKTHGSQTERSVPKLRGEGDFNNMLLRRIENQLKSFQDPPEEKLKRNNQLLKKISSHLTHILRPNNEENEELKPSRRMFNREEQNIGDESDAYYANLGRQIASVIKDVYPNSIPDSTPLPQPIFNGNGYSSRSFWERSVRSPTSHTILSEATTKQSLYDLENKVKNAATDVPFLSLSEIENIINMVNGNSNKQHDVQVHVSHTEHNSTRIMNLDLFPKNSIIPIKQNLTTLKETNLTTVPSPQTKYSIFKTVHSDLKNIVTTPKDNHEESKNQTQKSTENPNTLHKHHNRHHVHHHDHHHPVPHEPSHHKHLSKEDEKERNHDYSDGINQHKTHKNYEHISNKEADETQEKRNLTSENNYTISKNEMPTGYNIDDDVVDNVNHNLNTKRSNERINDNSNNKPYNLRNRKLNRNDDEYIDVNPSANMNINPNTISKDDLYAYPDVNHLKSLNENMYVYTNDDPNKSPVGNRNPNNYHNIEPTYSSLNPLLTNNGIPHAQLAAQNMYRPRPYNINGVPNEGPKLQSMFPNLQLDASNTKSQKYSNNPELSLNSEFNPMVNIEIPANFELNKSSSSAYGDRQYIRHPDVMPKLNNRNTRRSFVNDTERYNNYLPRPYDNISYNIAHRRQANAYPYPAIFKGARPSNQNKPIWTAFPGRGIRAFKKPHTPIFRSALFFDDFN